MTWWQKLFYGFNTNTVKEEDGRGGVTSPQFIASLDDDGYVYNDKWCWWVREWTTTGGGDRKKSVLEVYQLEVTSFGGSIHPDIKTEFGKKWVYMILNSEAIPSAPDAGWGGGAVIWRDDAGERE